jgi:leucyl aminopeptidase
MEYSVKSGHPEKQRGACVVVGVLEPRRLTPAAERLDEVSGGYLSALLRRGDMEGKVGQTLLLHNVPEVPSERVLLVGCGKERELGDGPYRKVVATAVKTLNETGSMEATAFLAELAVKGRDLHWKVRQGVEAAEGALYRFDQLKSKKEETRRPLRKIIWNVPSRRDLGDAEKALAEGEAVSAGVRLARDLGNLPGNICTPTYLAEQAQALAERHGAVHVRVLEQVDMEELKMGALLSVAKGSRQPPKLVVLEYRGGAADAKPYALVGKGITFDAGGISLKPADKMDEMKYDMGGAASVLGTFEALGRLGLPINVVGVVPTAENLPDGQANKPGDIVTSMSGQTIEVLNTDAEGRLILCDALTYTERFEPATVVDIATLTGACVVALGKHASGLLSNHSPLAHDLLNAGKESGDRAWELPLWEEYQEQLKSPFADMANIGGREAGAVTAACFLSRYAKKFHWAHLDVAGTAWVSGGENKGGTGRPVPLLTQYLLDRAAER